MKKALAGLALFAGLLAPAPASAADNTVVGVGTGAVAGAVVAGPVGAVVGAVAGGLIGANTPSARTRYRRRARAVTRRRAAEMPAAPRARFAARTAQPQGGVRAVSVPQPQSRPSADDAPVKAAPSGSTWTDPN